MMEILMIVSIGFVILGSALWLMNWDINRPRVHASVDYINGGYTVTAFVLNKIVWNKLLSTDEWQGRSKEDIITAIREAKVEGLAIAKEQYSIKKQKQKEDKALLKQV